MTRQVVNIGVEGNDGTGDSIREAFNKLNENFQELYAVFGQGGQIGFSSLSDTPSTLTDAQGNGNLLAISSSDGTAIDLRALEVSGLTVDYTSDPSKIKITNNGAAVGNDIQPTLGGDLDGLNLFSIGRIAISANAATQFNNTHGLTGTPDAISIDDLVPDKKYIDTNYASIGRPIPVRDEPVDATEYTLTISAVNGLNATVTAHGLNQYSTGKPYTFAGTTANGLTNGVTYYLKVVDEDNLQLFTSEANALSATAALTPTTGTLTNNNYDEDIPGFYLDNEALPRKNVTKRSGDKMTGALLLHDHPGSYSGVNSGVEEDFQAATKFYVDNTSFASTTNIYVSTQGDDLQTNTAYDRVGRSPSSAFKSINKAAQLAEELIATTRARPGPYMQTITYNTVSPAEVTAKGLTNSAGYTNMFALLTDNRQFIMDEVVAHVNATYPDFVYDTAICARDIGLILDSIKLDVNSGAATNFLTIEAGLRYFSNVSGRKAVSSQLTETVAGIQHARLVADRVLQHVAHTPTTGNSQVQVNTGAPANATARGAVLAKFDKIVEIMQGDAQGNAPGLASTGPIVEGSTYTIVVDNGGFGFLDQSNPSNLDLRAGKVIRGKTSKALGRIAEVDNGASEDTIKMQLLEPIEFLVGEELEFGNLVKDTQISIRVESGIYYEQLPIKVPSNVSIKGDEFRRVIVRPAEGVSTSPYAKSYFYRDATFDNLTLTSAGVVDPVTGGYYGHHYLSDPTDITSAPIDNSLMDVFLMGDASILRNMTVTGHGGFMCVLDPDNQVLTKSPYIQTATSLSQGINQQAFRGGMFIDAWCGNVPMQVITDASNTPFRLTVKTIGSGGLFVRKPSLPAPFYIDGIRYTVNAVTDYDQAQGSAVLILDPTSGANSGFTEVIPAFTDPDPNDPSQRSGGYSIFVQTGGNRSMLANDFTQVNDDGYGVVTMNGGLSELVSVFTYYCHTAYYAGNGGQIRSLNGSNAYGEYGLVAEGADPNEIPDAVGLIDSFVQQAEVFSNGGVYTNPVDQLYIYVTGPLYTPHARGEIEIDHGGLIGLTRYEIVTIENITNSDPLIVGSNARNTNVYKINFSTAGTGGTSDTGLKVEPTLGDPVTIRCNQNFKFDGVREVQPIRPSTAVKFTDEYVGFTYRSVAFGVTDGTGVALTNADETIVTIDQTFDYLRLAVKQSEIGNANADSDPGTMGAAAGDTMIAIEILSSQDDIDRLNNNALTALAEQPVLGSGQVRQAPYIFGWAGQIYEVFEYVERTGFATVKIQRYAGDSVGSQTGATGLGATLTRADYDITLRAGLQGKVDTALTTEVTNATITFKISTCRATGHDFLDIGTGSYNDSNYPNVVLGEPVIQNSQAREVEERTEGRVFYVSTDQDGFFRVGRFFTVDQGTGRVTFSASIALSNLDGIGFKRGVAITAFLTDTAMVDNATDAAPTQSAVVGYVNRRLGFTADGSAVPNPLSPFGGYLKLDGGTMDGSLNMFDNHIINVPDIDPDYNDDSVAVNKAYVDANLEAYNELTELRNMEIVNSTSGDLLVATGYYRIIVDNTVDGDWENHVTEALTTSSGATGVLIDAVDTLIRGDARTILTYELDAGSPQFPNTDTVSYSGGVNAQIISPGGIPVDEYANVHVDTTAGDIAISVTRNGPNAPGPDSYAALTIEDGKIFNNHVAANAAIEQSKLNMNLAAGAAAAPTGTAAQIQAASGLASFDEAQFDVTSGWASIQDGGITRAKLEDSTAGTALAREAGVANGPVQEVTFAHIFDNGGDFTTTGEANKVVKTTGTGEVVGTSFGMDGVTVIDYSGTSHNIYSKGGTKLIGLDGTTITVGGDIVTGGTAHNIGTSSNKFNTVYATTFDGTATSAQYADLAENYLGDEAYEPGTVVVFGGDAEITVTNVKGDHRVAGVVSTDPAYLMNSKLEGSNVIALALQGRVPCKVIGAVRKGDMLVTSAIPGYAIVNNNPGVGTVIGKAVANKTDGDRGVVEVVVGRV
jgi:hypothetical protein